MANVCLLHGILQLLVLLSWKHVVDAIEWPISSIDTTELWTTASAISDLFQLLNFLYAWGSLFCHSHFVLCVHCALSLCIVYLILFDMFFFIPHCACSSLCMCRSTVRATFCLFILKRSGSKICRSSFFFHKQFGKWSFIFLVNLNSKFDQVLFFLLLLSDKEIPSKMEVKFYPHWFYFNRVCIRNRKQNRKKQLSLVSI